MGAIKTWEFPVKNEKYLVELEMLDTENLECPIEILKCSIELKMCPIK